jgi:hypothetical protein
MDRPGSEFGQMAGTCKCCNEASGSIKKTDCFKFYICCGFHFGYRLFPFMIHCEIIMYEQKTNFITAPLQHCVWVKGTSSHKPADKFIVCVGNRICRFDVKALVLLSVHLI